MRRSRAGRYLWSRHVKSLIPTLIFAVVLAVAVPTVLFGFFVGIREPSLTTVGWMYFFLGALAGTLSLWTSRWERKYGRQEKGARGEIAVGRELEKLHLEGFHVFHDYKPEGSGNVDHFLIGSGGVFTVETKAWSGEISTDGVDILINGERPRKSPVKQASREATRIRHLLRQSGGIDARVRPVLCFVGEDLRVYGRVRGVEVTSLGALRRSIMQLSTEVPDEDRLSPSTVRVLSSRLSQHLGELPAASPESPPASPSRTKKLLRAGSVFVALYFCFIFVLSLLFAGNTATMFENFADFYRAIEALKGFYL